MATPQQVVERSVEPTSESSVETPGLSSEAAPVVPIAGGSTESSKSLGTYDEEADTVKSMGSDQSDEIETRSINGDGGDYVLLETTQSPEVGSPQNIDILPMPGELQVTGIKTPKSYRVHLFIHVAIVH